MYVSMCVYVCVHADVHGDIFKLVLISKIVGFSGGQILLNSYFFTLAINFT